MNDFPTKNTPPAATGPTSPPGGGLKSTLRILIPVGLLVAVIFGVTFFSQYTPPDEDKPVGPGGAGKDPPLRFFSSTRHRDPANFEFLDEITGRYPFRGLPLSAPSADPTQSDTPFKFSLQDRTFPGAFEYSSEATGPRYGANFWFENPHDKAVNLQLRSVSCSACSGARLAPVPPEVTRQLLQMSGVSALPQGLVTGLPVGMVGPGANLHPDRLDWQAHTFEHNPQAAYKVPPADKADGWAPQWGILRLEFSVGAVGPKVLTAKFNTSVEGTSAVETNEFSVATEGVNAFDLWPPAAPVGEMTENSEPRKFEVIAYSSTRGPNRTGSGEPGDLQAPTASVRKPVTQGGGEPGPFVTVGPPVRVPEAELAQVARDVATQRPGVRVEAAYRYPVTVSPKVGDARADIGTLEREVWFALGNNLERHVRLSGMVRGAVWLDDDRTDVAMPNFPVTTGGSKQFRLVTAQRDLDVAVVMDELRPKFLQVTLEKDASPASADRGYYALKVKVPSQGESSLVRTGSYSGEIVLEVKGPTPQRIRIPVKGRVEPR